MNFKADVKQTGATRTINGFQTKETVLTLESKDRTISPATKAR